MPDLIGVATFPGISNIMRATYTLSHGITPGVCSVEMVPQAGIINVDGDLVFSFGPTSLLFRNCRINEHSIQRTGEGLIWRLNILDRRWRWRYGEISGNYNVRFNDMNSLNSGGGLVGQSLDPNYKRTTWQLAQLLLAAMGEPIFDITQLPNDTYPEVRWKNDNPARALQELAERHGCRLVLTLSGIVQLAKIGVGQLLPNGPIITDSLTIDPPERPDSIKVVCGPNRHDVDIELEAVGEDMDGSIKRLADLSYKPEGGWGSEVPGAMTGISDTPSGQGRVARNLAQQTVYRWYRIMNRGLDFDGFEERLNIQGHGKIDRLDQILPIEDVQVATFTDFDGSIKSLPAHVYGTYYSRDLGFKNSPPFTHVTDQWSIDRERGIVRFNEPIYKLTDGVYQEALLYLLTAVSVRDKTTNAYTCYQSELRFGTAYGTGPQILPHDEIIYQTTVIYDQGGQGGDRRILGYLDNKRQVQAEAGYYLAGAAAEYGVEFPQEIHYSGLVPIGPDGAIQQVTWTVDCEAGCTSSVSRNNEFNLGLPSFRERRMYEDLRDKTIRKLKDQVAKANIRTGPK